MENGRRKKKWEKNVMEKEFVIPSSSNKTNLKKDAIFMYSLMQTITKKPPFAFSSLLQHFQLVCVSRINFVQLKRHHAYICSAVMSHIVEI